MKKLLLLFSAALTMLFVGCTQFDDTRIWDAIDELEDLFDDLDNRVEYLEEACEKMNTNIEALQTIVAALQANDTITSIAPIKQGDKIIGYTISFSKSEPITIYHGNDGKDSENGEDGYTPQIGIAKDSDNVYYWTLNGEWLLDENGNKIKAVGTDGKDGEDGEDGITPQLEIRDGYWYISYDNGQSWVELGKATGEDGKDGANGADGEDGKDGENGEDGKDGDSLFQSVTWDEEYAYFTLSDGTVIKISLSDGAITKTVEITAVALLGFEDHGMLGFCLSDVGFDLEGTSDAGGFLPNSRNYILVLTVDIDDYSVVPQGTFTSEAGDFETGDGCSYYYFGDNWEDSCNINNAVVIVSEDKIEATLTLNNGEVHHVVYEGSLKLHEEDTTTPPANEIWYTSTDGEVVTPYNADAFGVNIISNTYENGVGIITFDGDVTEIGIWAFGDCSSLASVTIPDSVTEIGEDAFDGCSSLASVTIPDSVTEIGGWAFCVCSSLASVTIPDGVTSIGAAAFSGCSSLTSIVIPESVTEIGEGAFTYCSSLTSFYGKYASEDGRCLIVDGTLNSFAPAGLTEYTIPDSVTSIGEEAFANCTSLTSITIPESVTSIGGWAFQYSSSLASVTIPNSVTSIGEGAFNFCSSLTSITIPDGVTSIGDYAFRSCSSLTNITIPDSVTTIGGEAFVGCESLASVSIGNGVTSIGYEAFYYCTSLASVTIPDSVTEIGVQAFAYCWSLASVTIGSGVEYLGYRLFYYCDNLVYLFCNSSTPPILMHSSDMGHTLPLYLRAIYVPAGSEEAYKTADGWSDYADIIGVYEPEKYGSWIGEYTLSGQGSVYDSESESYVESEIEFTITVEAKDETELSYNVYGWGGYPYSHPMTAYFITEDRLVLMAGIIAEDHDFGNGNVGDICLVGWLPDNYIQTRGGIVTLSKEDNQAVGIDDVYGTTFAAVMNGEFYLVQADNIYLPLTMTTAATTSNSAPSLAAKANAFNSRNWKIDKTHKLHPINK